MAGSLTIEIRDEAPRFEIREKSDGYEVIDLERRMWLATFRMFEDAKFFAQWLKKPDQ